MSSAKAQRVKRYSAGRSQPKMLSSCCVCLSARQKIGQVMVADGFAILVRV